MQVHWKKNSSNVGLFRVMMVSRVTSEWWEEKSCKLSVEKVW